MIFYELQQRTQTRWTCVGFFLDKQNARDHMEDFNTKTQIAPMRIQERDFLDFGDFKSIRDFIFRGNSGKGK